MNLKKHTLFLSRLPEASNDEMVERLLAPYGFIDKVKLKMIKNGKACAGYGFVELFNEEIFHRILSDSAYLRVCGRPIKVEVNERGVTLKAYKRELDQRKVYIIGIPQSARDEDLREALKSAGDIERAYTIKEGHSQESKHYGYAIFCDVVGAENALRIKKFRLGKYRLTCKPFASKKKKKNLAPPKKLKLKTSSPSFQSIHSENCQHHVMMNQANKDLANSQCSFKINPGHNHNHDHNHSRHSGHSHNHSLHCFHHAPIQAEQPIY
jgi:RNA recognition motif-containing protein